MMLRRRFSLRSLAIVVTLICAYFAAWEATKRYGLRDVLLGSSALLEGDWFEKELLVMQEAGDASVPMPFVVSQYILLGSCS
jgi:hypothetical protein